MSDNIAPPLSLEDAKQLVSFIESGDNAAANALIEAASLKDSMELFAEVGKLTRQLHDSLNSFQLDNKIADLAHEEIPDAQSRLNYVMDMTEQAANKTMDAVESCMPMIDQMGDKVNGLMPVWKKLMARELELGEFKELCKDLDAFLNETTENSQSIQSKLTEVLMAQDFQDLTGQVIRKVIVLVGEVEENLVNLLTVFGAPELDEEYKKAKEEEKRSAAEGPIVDADKRDDVAASQDDVDDLLSSLGF